MIKMFFKLVTNVSATNKRVAKYMKELQWEIPMLYSE